LEQEVFCDSYALALVACVGGRWADGLVVVLRYYRSSPWLPYLNVRVFSSGKVVACLVVAAALGVVVHVGFSSACAPYSLGAHFQHPLNCCIVLGGLYLLFEHVN
jgi:hypothetical protein